jgi:hypothetical protein
MAKGEHSTPFRVIFAIAETVAIVSGFALTVFGRDHRAVSAR